MNSTKVRSAIAASWRRSKGTRRGLVAVAIAYLFLLVLVTASLQQGVAERLAGIDPPQDYSNAYAVWREGDSETRRELGRLRIAARGLAAEREAAERSRVDEGDNILGLEGPLRALRQSLRAVTACGFAEHADFEMHEISEAISLLRECLEDPAIPRSTQAAANAFLATRAATLEEAAGRYVRFGRAEESLDRRIQGIQQAIAAREQAQRDFVRIEDSFADLRVLDRPWLAGGGLVAAFPPPVVQILLSFVSGLFGALLVTLVLLVYPNTEFDLTSDKARYGARLLLGGLISLCVFVVLGGGTAVLGADDAFSKGEANYLAFCAIGILAGMFSDRVAHWLSTRASDFFHSNRQDEPEEARKS